MKRRKVRDGRLTEAEMEGMLDRLAYENGRMEAALVEIMKNPGAGEERIALWAMAGLGLIKTAESNVYDRPGGVDGA